MKALQFTLALFVFSNVLLTDVAAASDSTEARRSGKPCVVFFGDDRAGDHVLSELQIERIVSKISGSLSEHHTELIIIRDKNPERMKTFVIYDAPQKTYSVNLPPNSTFVSATILSSKGEKQTFINATRNVERSWLHYTGWFNGSFVEFRKMESSSPKDRKTLGYARIRR